MTIDMYFVERSFTTATHPRAGILSEMPERWLKWVDRRFFSRNSWISPILSEVGFNNSGITAIRNRYDHLYNLYVIGKYVAYFLLSTYNLAAYVASGTLEEQGHRQVWPARCKGPAGHYQERLVQTMIVFL